MSQLVIGVLAPLTLLVAGSTAAAVEEQCVDLVAEKTLVLGQVCASERADTLLVRYAAREGWRLTESHVAVATTVEGIPSAGGQHPVLGRFPHKEEHGPGVTSYVYAVPLTGDLAGARSLVVAAHASLAQGQREEGAWGAGQPFAAEGNPATYFRYARAGN